MPCPKAPARLSPAARITAAIVERLEAGVRPWVRPWDGAARERPLRACGAPYRGTNLFWLWLVAEARGYASRYWMTYAQAAALGGQVRRGERSTPAIFFKPGEARPADPEAGDGEPQAPRLVLRSHALFNADQVDGLPARYLAAAPALAPWPGRLPAVAAFFARLPGEVRIGGTVAAYDRSADVVLMPDPDRFASDEAFYATFAHERAHWTGHRSRLARDFGGRFGDAAYAVEELCAELASAILGAELGLPVTHLDDHAAYIASWIRVLRAEPRHLLSVASKAEAAADYLIALGRAATPDAGVTGAEERRVASQAGPGRAATGAP
jgi:antirestriction protein ArdC